MLRKLMLLVPAALIATTLTANADTFRVSVAYRNASLPAIARDLDRAASELRAQAESEIFARGAKRQQALAAIRDFDRDASRFRALVTDPWVGHLRLEREYRELLRSFDRTAWAFERNLRPSRFLVEDFRRVEISMNRLIDRFEDRVALRPAPFREPYR